MKSFRMLANPMGNYLKRLQLFGKISERDFDLEFGKYCKIPRCCIDFYIRLCSVGYMPGFMADLVLGREPRFHDYVRCPRCRQITEDFDFSNFHPKFQEKLREKIKDYYDM
jgi:hypothetical protein